MPGETAAYLRSAHATLGEFEGMPVVFVNPAGADVIYQAQSATRSSLSSAQTLGMMLHQNAIANIRTQMLLAQAAGNRVTDFGKALAKLGPAIEQGLQHPAFMGGLPVVQIDPKSISPKLTLRTLHEEADHAKQYDVAGRRIANFMPEGYFSHPQLHTAAAELEKAGYDNPLSSGYDWNNPLHRLRLGALAMEIGVRLMRPGRFQELNLTFEQALDLAEHTIENLAAHHGERARGIIDQTYAAFQKPVFGAKPNEPGGLQAGRAGPGRGGGDLAEAGQAGAPGVSPQPYGPGEPAARTGEVEPQQGSLFARREVPPAERDVKRRTMEDLDLRIPQDVRVVSPDPTRTITGQPFHSLDLEKPAEGFLPFQRLGRARANALIQQIWRKAIQDSEATGGATAAGSVRSTGARPPDTVFWQAALSLMQRARFWYELSGEALTHDHVDLPPRVQGRLIDTVAGTSGGLEPYGNLKRGIGILAEDMQRQPVMVDLRDPVSARNALAAQPERETLKYGSFGGTMKYTAGLAEKRPLTTNDVQVAKMFGLKGEDLGKNPVLYEVLSRFFMGLRDAQNAELPAGAQPWETWQLQAPGWVHQRILDNPRKASEYDDYAQVFPKVIQELKDAGVPVPNNKITIDTLLDKRTPNVMSGTRERFMATPVATVQARSELTEAGRAAAATRAKLDLEDQNESWVRKAKEAYDKIDRKVMRLLATRKEVDDKKIPSIVSKLMSAVAGRKIDVSRLDWNGHDVSPDGTMKPVLRIPMTGTAGNEFVDLTPVERRAFMAILGKELDQPGVDVSHFGLLDAGETPQTFSLFVQHHAGELEPDLIGEFRRELGYPFKVVRYPNGTSFEINVPEGKPAPTADQVNGAFDATIGRTSDVKAESVQTFASSYAGERVGRNEYADAESALRNERRGTGPRSPAEIKRDLVRRARLAQVQREIRNVARVRDAESKAWTESTEQRLASAQAKRLAKMPWAPRAEYAHALHEQGLFARRRPQGEEQPNLFNEARENALTQAGAPPREESAPGPTQELAEAPTGYVQLGPRQRIPVRTADQASAVVRRHIEMNDWGASDMPEGFGDIRDAKGNLIARVSYNGRVWSPEGRMLQGAFDEPEPAVRRPEAQPQQLTPREQDFQNQQALTTEQEQRQASEDQAANEERLRRQEAETTRKSLTEQMGLGRPAKPQRLRPAETAGLFGGEEEPGGLFARRAPTPEQQKAEADKRYAQNVREWFTSRRDLWAARVHQHMDLLRKQLPDVADREGLYIMREFRNRPGQLKQWLAGTHPEFRNVQGDLATAKANIEKLRPAIEKALNPTPQMLAADKVLTHIAEVSLREGQRIGFIEHGYKPEEYVPHLLGAEEEGKEPDVAERLGKAIGGRLGKYFPHALERIFPTVLDAVANNQRPETIDSLKAFETYGDRFATARATHLLTQQLRDSGTGIYASPGQKNIPAGWVPITKYSDEFTRRIAFVPPSEGTEVPEPEISTQKLYVPRKVRDALRPITDPHFLGAIKGFETARAFQAWTKAAQLGMSFFHLTTENYMALANMGPTGWFKAINTLSKMDTPLFLEQEGKLIKHGGTTAIQGPVFEGSEGLTETSLPTAGEAWRTLPGIRHVEKLAQGITNLTFGRFQRVFKVVDFSIHEAAWLAKHRNAMPTEYSDAMRSIAKEVNAVYGGLHQENLGVNKTTYEAVRTFMLAPDWTLSNVFNVKYAFMKTPGGKMARRFWLRAVVGGLVATQLMSLLMSKKLSKRPTQVYMGKDDDGSDIYQNLFFKGAPGDVANFIGNVKDYGLTIGTARTIGNKGGAIARSVLQGMANRSFLGRPLVPHGMHPIASTVRGTYEVGKTASPIPWSLINAYDMMFGPEASKYKVPLEVLTTMFAGTPPTHVVPPELRPPAKPSQSIWQQIVTGKVAESEVKTPEQEERTRLKRQLTEALREGSPIPDDVKEAQKAGKLTTRDLVEARKEARMSDVERGFVHLSWRDAINAYQQANTGERAKLRPMLSRKAANAIRIAPPADRQRIVQEYRQAIQ